ncbi:hypothetical protein M1394_00100 [Candidatus Marsarchaeota archaeon]|nr:hypothetical protein [Candidatus Marsarchaeota archaeon]
MKISSPTRQIMGNKIIYNKDHNIVIASYNKYEIINSLVEKNTFNFEMAEISIG